MMLRRIRALVLAGVFGVMSGPIVLAQGREANDTALDKLTSAVNALSEQIRDLKDSIRSMSLAARPAAAVPSAPETAVIDIDGFPTLGKADINLVMVEFADFQCPFCARYTRDTYAVLKQEYVDSGRIKYVFRHFPLSNIHDMAQRASSAAECAHGIGKFWDIHDAFFRTTAPLNEATVHKIAADVGVTEEQLSRCMNDTDTLARVQADTAEGVRLGITGTPTFLIGRLGSDGRLRVERRIVGAQPLQAFKSVLDQMLNKSER